MPPEAGARRCRPGRAGAEPRFRRKLRRLLPAHRDRQRQSLPGVSPGQGSTSGMCGGIAVTLRTMTVPDDPAELPRWLERRVMAPDFGLFIAELQAHFPAAENAPCQPPFNRWLPIALSEGFDSIPLNALSQLLRHPAELAAVQERIVVDGGAYWDQIAEQSDELVEAVESGRQSLDRIFAANTTSTRGKRSSPPKSSTAMKATPSGALKRGYGRGYKTWAYVSTGIAACLVVALGLLAFREPAETRVPKSQIAWGWGKPSGLATEQNDSKSYLNKLADNV